MAARRSNPAEAVTPPEIIPGDRLLGRSSLVRLLALAVFLAATVAAGHFLSARMEPLVALRAWVNRAGSAGPLLFVVLFLALNTVGLPLPVLGAAAGVAFGPIPGATTALAAMAITACAQFLFTRYIVGEQVRRRLGRRVARLNQVLERRGVIAVAGARLLPGPFSEFNMLAALTSLKLRDFMIGTILGCIPKALAWSGIGASFV
jgi:uncharacterized membrane protein YdjX (TVP38/TMEM64 family)